MRRIKFVALAIVLAWAASATGSPTGVSVAINFAADEPEGALEAFVDGAAGVAGTVNWNNLEGPSDISDEIFADVMGVETATGVEVEWVSNNTWASDGRGAEDQNDAPPGNDRRLMLGYLDTTDNSITEIAVSNLPQELHAGFDVFVYVLGGVLNRGGTYTVEAGGTSLVQENIQTATFDGSYVQGDEGNYLLFQGLSGDSLLIEAMATTPDLFRAPLNAIEICAPGACLALPTPVAGRGTIGDQEVATTRANEVFGPGGDPAPGLAQEWVAQGNPGNKAAIDNIFTNSSTIVPPFRAGHGTTWWTGDQAPFGDLVQYPDEVQPPFNDTNNDNYVVRATGEILVPESGTYRFADGTDDYTYLAIDSDKSGTAGDSPEEVLIDDNAWTGVFREQNNGGQGLGEIDIDVAEGGEWLAIEFNMGEGGGSDAGVIYWDYNPEAPEGQRLGGAEGFPEFSEDPIFPEDAELMYIPDSHLRSQIRALISADLVASITNVELGLEFDIDGDNDASDTLVLNNPDPNLFTTILDVDGVAFHLSTTGSFNEGDTFTIIDADVINGTPTIVSQDAWTFNPLTGQITFGAGLAGDYNNDGSVDVLDIDLQAMAMNDPNPNLGTFDENGDGVVNIDDRLIWVNTHRGTWMGDSNLDGEFNSGDLVAVFTAGKYDTGEAASWADGDWNGDQVFSSGDLVIAFQEGGFEIGPRPAAAAVPEPTALALLAIALMIVARRRTV